MTEQQIEQFEAVTRPVVEWLNANCHPHAMVLIDNVGATLHTAACGYTTNDYLRG